MNICNFTGFMLEDPKLSQGTGVSHLVFKLVTYTYRKSKNTGEKQRMPTVLTFEAWHTGAETIAKLGKKCTKITVNCSAKNAAGDDDFVIFRINEFDFACLDQD